MENNSILCCINGFKPSEAVIDYGAWLSKRTQTKLKLFHAIDTQYTDNVADLSGSIGLGAREELLNEFVETEHEQNKLLLKRAKLILDAGQERAQNNGATSIDICLRKGKVIENVLELKDKISIAVIGRYGEKHQGVYNTAAVGHKVESIVRALEKPILIISKDFSEPNSLCLAFDGSDGAKKGLDFVIKNSCFHDLDIHLVHVGEETEKLKSDMDEAKAALDKVSLKSRIVFLEGDTSERLKEYIHANDISILTMGAFSHSWIHDLVVGSLTSNLISIIKIPILLVR